MNTNSLLKLEWNKFWPNATFRTVFALYLSFYGLLLYMVSLVGSNFTFNGNHLDPTQDLFSFPRVWELVGYIGSLLNVMILGFLAIHTITLEIQHRTLRQNIICGLTRSDVFKAKLISMVALAFVVTVVYLLLGFITGLHGKAPENWTEALPPLTALVNFFLQALGYLVLGLLIGFFVRQTALATLLYLSYVLVIERIVRGLLFFLGNHNPIENFFPSNILNELVRFPTPTMAQSMATNDSLAESTLLLVAAAYIILFSGIIYHRLQKSDL